MGEKRKVKATHQTCPQCKHDECFTEFEDGTGFCHSVCAGLVDVNGTSAKKTTERPSKDVALVPISKVYRNIQPELYEAHGGTLVAIEGTTEPYAMLYAYPHGPKKRILPKDFSDNKGFTNDHWFGMDEYNAGSSKVLTIVEGEDDRFAALQMIGGTWPIVAAPGGSISKTLLKNVKEWTDSFQSIVIASDNDDAGDRMAEIIARNFPNKCYRVPLTKYKDAMEYLDNDDEKDFVYAWVNRQKYVMPFDTNTPEQFVKMFHESVDNTYLPTGIEAYDDVALGLFQGEFTVFTAPEGVGKTELLRYLEYSLVRNHPDVPFAYCHLEEVQRRSLLGLVSYHLEENLTRKELIDSEEKEARVIKAINEIMGRENIHQFKVSPDEDPDVLVERIKYYANVCDCKYVFFEPIQDIAHQRRQGDLTEFLDKLSVNLSRTAADTGCGIITVAHANDDGDTRDSKQIQKQASVKVELQRDMESEDPIQQFTTRLVVKKNRPVGTLGAAGCLEFKPDSFTLVETDGLPF